MGFLVFFFNGINHRDIAQEIDLFLYIRIVRLIGTVHRFYMGGQGNRLPLFSIFAATPVEFMVSRISLIAPLLILVDNFGPIRDTNRSTVAATGTEQKFA